MQSVHRTFGAVAVVAACATMGCTTETTSSAGGEPESSSTLEDGLTAGAPMTSRPTRLLARFPASATTKQQTGGAVVNWELYPQYSANHFDYPSGAGVLMGYILVGADASGRARVAAVASGHFAPVAGAPRATSGTRIRGTPLIGTTMSARGGSAKRATETVWMPVTTSWVHVSTRSNASISSGGSWSWRSSTSESTWRVMSPCWPHPAISPWITSGSSAVKSTLARLTPDAVGHRVVSRVVG